MFDPELNLQKNTEISGERIWQRIIELENEMNRANWSSAYAVANDIENELIRLHQLLRKESADGTRNE